MQDAVAAANRLARPPLDRSLTIADLRAVQDRRMFPTRATQAFQVLAQRCLLAPTLAAAGCGRPLRPPLPLRMVDRLSPLQRLPTRAVGLGVRPEHVAPALRRPAAGVRLRSQP